MNVNLRIASVGIVVALLLSAAVVVVEEGIFAGMLRIPSIVIGLVLSCYLASGRRLALEISTILLSVSVVVVGSATLYIGVTSSLYPTWKIISCTIITLICAGSLTSLIIGNRSIDQGDKA